MKLIAVIAYLVLLLGAAAALLLRKQGLCPKRMGICVLTSALSWACALIPGLLTGLAGADRRLWLGLGRLGFAAGSAVWVFLLYRLWERLWSPRIRDRLMFLVCAAGVLFRLLSLVPPENHLTENGYSLLWSSLGCGALLIAGAVPTAAWFGVRRRSLALSQVWLLLLAWLAFSIPLSALGRFPILTWLQVPQAAATLGIAICFLREKN